MKGQKEIMHLLGILFFWAGVLLGMTLVGGEVWADIEAACYRTTALTGNQIFALLVAVSLSSMAARLVLWQVSRQPLKGQILSATWAMRVLAIIVVVGMFVAFQGWWAVGVLTIVLMVLMIVAMMYLAAPD